MMAKACIGAWVQYCGHNGCFIADIWEVGDANVIVASFPILPEMLDRQRQPTHHMVDFPKNGYWKPSKGIFVVPQKQVTNLLGEDE
jgi:hypothetical protein